MKTKFLSPSLLSVCSLFFCDSSHATLPFEAYSAPKLSLGSFTHPNGELSRTLVYRTLPGVKYCVEWSNDLQTWTKDEGSDIYGFGQEVVYPMLTQAAASSSSSSGGGTLAPYVPSKAVFLMMQPVSGSTTGLVVTWTSLDNGSIQYHHFSDLTIASAWTRHAGFVKRCGDFTFCITNPIVATAAKVNVTHGTLDTAMLDAFSNNFAAMNSEAVASVANTTMNPQNVSNNSGARKFFRVCANWAVDTDGDMIADWQEYANFLSPEAYGLPAPSAPTTPPTVGGNPFNGDEDGDGVADGNTVDSDGDGKVDMEDADANSEVADWKRLDGVRYAVFPFVAENPYDSNTAYYPRRVNAQGTALFPYNVWKGGVLKNLVTQANDIGYTTAGINDDDMIVGSGSGAGITGLAVWADTDANPNIVFYDYGEFLAYPQLGYGFNNQDFTNDRKITANTTIFVPKSYDPYPTSWPEGMDGDCLLTLNAGGNVSDKQFDVGVTALAEGGASANWNNGAASFTGINTGYLPEGAVTRLVRLDNGTYFAGAGNFQQAFAGSKNGVASNMEGLFDMSTDGIGVTYDGTVWMNGKRLSLTQAAPDLSGVFANGAANVMDMSLFGHILLAQIGGAVPSNSAVAFPVKIADNEPDTGVDITSCSTLVPNTDPGWTDRPWVMAPCGQWTDSSGNAQDRTNEFSIAMGLGSSICNLACGTASITPSSISGLAPSTVAMHGSGNTTTADHLNFTMAGAASASNPVGVYTMKARTVEVQVHKIVRLANDPAPVTPSAAAIKNRLMDIYGKQANLNFNVNIDASSRVFDFDNQNNGGDGNGYVSSQNEEDAMFNFLTTAEKDASDIHIFFVKEDLVYPSTTGAVVANGVTGRNKRFCIIFDGQTTSSYRSNTRTLEDVMQTISHECGHCMIGFGHPDFPGSNPADTGPSPLWGTNRSVRIMCSGVTRKSGAHQTVYKEWVAIDDWAKHRARGDY